MRKLSYSYIKSSIEDSGYKLLSDVYVNSTSKLRVECDKGHEYLTSWRNFSSGHRCPICFESRRGMSQKLSYEYIKSRIEAEGHELLSDSYKNAHTKLKIRCSCGHVYEPRWANFNNGSRCPICSRERCRRNRCVPIEVIHKFIEEEASGYKLLSRDYVNNRTKMEFMCPQQHKFEMSWGNFSQGQRCPVCANKRRGSKPVDINYIRSYAARFGYTLLSEKFVSSVSHLEFICDRGHNASISWSNFRKGHRCRKCWIESRTIYKDQEKADSYYAYKECVDRLSNYNFRKYYYIINPYRLERAYDKYHLDHIYSISDGFKNNIPPHIIANPSNLQLLWCTDNMKKHNNSDVTIKELYERYNKFKELMRNDEPF